MKRLLISLVLFILASSLSAAELGKRGKKEYMGACGVSEAGLIYVITNGSNAASCDAAQTVGALRIYCSCTPDGEGGYAWGLLDAALGGEEVDLSGYALTTALDAYVLLAGDEDGQTIYGVSGGANLLLNGNGGFLYSADESSNLHVANGEANIVTNGVIYLEASGSLTIVTEQTPPTNANDACTAGDFIPTTGFIYFCVATDTWQRVAIATWP